ncbi:Nramp family divalent metal transporter [Pseudonocardia sp. T1-2H]|uniref:Nramp family divalent metal transporter n=1 Tax=Pseudonocardia sp. T1-2H TaxID=3128899 RepID=UPI00310105EB
MTSTDRNDAVSSDPSQNFPVKYLPRPQVRDLPSPPLRQWRYVGPGIVAAGVGLASGEFILFPYIASQVGLTFVWAALLGLITQYFLNMEIERYTLATGETAVTGFSRLWKHWGLVFAILAYFANIWPAWATSSATLVTYAFGGNAAVIAVVILVLVGLILTLAPIVYNALEKAQMVKVAAIVLLIVVGALVAIGPAWADTPQILTRPGFPVAELGFALLMGALAFAGAGGGQNLVQSNWIRDKGFGMGHYLPKIVSPLTGEAEARGRVGFVFPPTEQNLAHWRGWWRFANREQLLTFVLISFVSIVFMSLLAYATVFGNGSVTNDISFLQVEGRVLMGSVGTWFGYFFWIIGAVALFTAALGIVDYTSRLAADVLKTMYFPGASESKLYAGLVWGLVIIGILVISVGFSQPLALAVISACTGGTMMFIYSGLLIAINRKMLPKPIRIGGFRAAALIWSFLLFGVLAVLTVQQQIGKLLG